MDTRRAIAFLQKLDPSIRLDGLSADDLSEELLAAAEFLADEWSDRFESVRFDVSSEPTRKVIRYGGLDIEITHQPGDRRFSGSHPMTAAYGRVRRSYGDGDDGKAIDVYWGGKEDAQQAYKIRQLDPKTGTVDETKWMLGFPSLESARDTYLHHVGVFRFGGIEPGDLEELNSYRPQPKFANIRNLNRADGCGCPDDGDRLRSGVAILPDPLKQRLSAAHQKPIDVPVLLRDAIATAYPEPVLRIIQWQNDFDGGISGEFVSPVGVYGFRYQKGYLGYGWRRELGEDRFDAAPEEKVWVPNPRCKQGGYYRAPRNSKKSQVVEDAEESDRFPTWQEIYRQDAEPQEDWDAADWIIEDAQKRGGIVINTWLQEFLKWTQQFDSLQGVLDNLDRFYERMQPTGFMKTLEEKLLLAELAGRLEVEEEADFETLEERIKAAT